MESKESGAGLATLAAELQVELPKAMRLLREIQDCLTASASASAAAVTAMVGDSSSSSNVAIEIDKENQPCQTQSHTETRTNPANEAPTQTPEAPMILTPPPMLTASDLLAQLHPPHSSGSARRHKTASGNDKDISSHKSTSQSTPGGIITFCRSIDTLLFTGGIPLGSVTECAGLPGVGKTQLAMQLAVNARLPRGLGGVEGQTLYVDAEGSLVAERLHTMAQALLHHAQGTVRRRRPHDPSLPADFSKVEQVLDSIHVFRVHDEASQTATLYSLPYWIELINNNSAKEGEETSQSIPVKLIVVDSIAFHYRTQNSASKEFYLHRTRALTQMAAFLNDLARDYNVAVVCLNQMTTKMDNNVSRLVPALGESWAHAVTTRLLLSQEDLKSPRRVCRLVKSPCMPSGTAFYQVTESGIRDVSLAPTVDSDKTRDDDENEELNGNATGNGTRMTNPNQQKRLRTI